MCTAQHQQRYETLIMEHDIEKGAVHMDATIVGHEAQLPELIHEETDAGACDTDHLGKHVLTHLRNLEVKEMRVWRPPQLAGLNSREADGTLAVGQP